ncbi:hypothetical protein [Senegalia sp. (in: firmicutes)]|uniref:hypothetical protein n=1 Tax=Senegalia sp. (in: firmicutes) TaxID=1924098 RepID=UPI003F972028
MDLIISVIIFIIVFAIIRDIIFYIENKYFNIKSLIYLNRNLKFGIKIIGLLVIMFISFEIINFTNPFVEGAFI